MNIGTVVYSNYYIIILAIILGSMLIGGIIALIIVSVKRNNRIKQSEVAAANKVEESTSDLAFLFGSKKNIKEITSTGSRVSVELNDISKVDIQKIKEIYKDVLFNNNKAVFVVGEKSKEFASLLEKKLNK